MDRAGAASTRRVVGLASGQLRRRRGSRRLLTTAATTYIAAAVTAGLQLLYYVSIANRRW
ncbi:MAG: zinc metallopeptidase [Anaerolineae bacterium]|nr:zinc metallopeptidase [Anaerolineae bacterium]MCB0242876.1 zinc metallopeptidase [Anaerolineae bacterium]MCB0249887.1 zinc metallopeptidase [Anaerolineae bacterium]MCB9130174.1 zinc metallopeptidase [Anaerolineales bacterium]MCO5243025.1 zinc metallopeptidase [Anaerolineae bacterium]